MLVDAAKHLGLPIMHRKPCNRAFSQGKHVAPLLGYARINELVLPLSALSANQNGLATLHAVQGRGSSCITSTLCPESCRPNFRNSAAMFLRFSFFFFRFGLPAFCLAKNTLVKAIPGGAHIQIQAASEARALAG